MDTPLGTLGPYVLKRRLGEGGMGKVYVAQRLGQENADEIALKVIAEPYGSDPSYIEAFRRESALASALDHPNIVRVLDQGEAVGRPYLAMELLHGRSLADLWGRSRTLETWWSHPLAVHVIAEAAFGLHHLHQAGLGQQGAVWVHGDVSPQNIFLTHHGEVKVIDFGLAHSALKANDDRHPAKAFGKVQYLSPEQALGRPLDPRTDVFSLGATLFEALCGASAFSATSKYLVLMRITQGEPDGLRSHLPDAPRELSMLVDRALRHEPGERFQSALEMAEACQHYLEAQLDRPTQEDVARTLTEVFGDEVDGARPDLNRRATAEYRDQRLTERQRQTARMKETQALRQHQLFWLAVGLGVGLLIGLAWLLLK